MPIGRYDLRAAMLKVKFVERRRISNAGVDFSDARPGYTPIARSIKREIPRFECDARVSRCTFIFPPFSFAFFHLSTARSFPFDRSRPRIGQPLDPLCSSPLCVAAPSRAALCSPAEPLSSTGKYAAVVINNGTIAKVTVPDRRQRVTT